MVSNEFKLWSSTDHGTTPLTVGFVLTGSNITENKIWHFGSSKTDIINDLVYNVRFPYSSAPQDVWVEIVDVRGNFLRKTEKITINLTPGPTDINFDQWEGVIIKGQAIGFDIGTDLTGTIYQWVWNEGEPVSSDKEPNPFHYYRELGVHSGHVDVWGYDRKNNWVQCHKEFFVLVLDYPSNWWIYLYQKAVLPPKEIVPGSFLPDQDVHIFAQYGTGSDPLPDPSSNYRYTWDFGDGKPAHQQESQETKNTYADPGNCGFNYKITCLITDVEHPKFKITLQATVPIRD